MDDQQTTLGIVQAALGPTAVWQVTEGRSGQTFVVGLERNDRHSFDQLGIGATLEDAIADAIEQARCHEPVFRRRR